MPVGGGAGDGGYAAGLPVEGKGAVIESVLIGQGKLRVNQRGGTYWLLYDSSTGELYYVNAADHSYLPSNMAEIDRLGKFVDAANRLMDESWPVMLEAMRQFDRYPAVRNPGAMARANLPRVIGTLRRLGAAAADMPTEKELAEVYRTFDAVDAAGGMEAHFRQISMKHYQWMLDSTGGYQVRKIGRETIRNRECEMTQVSFSTPQMKRPGKVIDYCVAVPDALQLPVPDQKVLGRFSADSNAATRAMGDIQVVPTQVAKDLGIERTRVRLGADQIRVEGISLLSRFYTGEQVISTSELASVTSGLALDPALFRLPATYKAMTPSDARLEQALAATKASIAFLEAVLAETREHAP